MVQSARRPGDDRVAWDPLIQADDPYPVYRRLRDEAALYRNPDRDIWALSRFDDVQAAAKDWETFSSQAGGTGNDADDTYQLFEPAGDIAAADPPLHTRLRGAVRLAFSPSQIRLRFEDAARVRANRLIDGFADAEQPTWRRTSPGRCRRTSCSAGSASRTTTIPS